MNETRSDTERIPPLSPKEWPPEMRDALSGLRPPDSAQPDSAQPDSTKPARSESQPKGLNVLGTFAHHPELARAYLGFNGHLLNTSTLIPRHRELLVLRVAAIREADYEWAQHALIALDCDITAAEIERVKASPSDSQWTDLETAILSAADELIRDAELTDATYAALSSEFNEKQILDLVFTVGAYDVLAMALRVCRTPLDDDLCNG